jgi:hypothetical protein
MVLNGKERMKSVKGCGSGSSRSLPKNRRARGSKGKYNVQRCVKSSFRNTALTLGLADGSWWQSIQLSRAHPWANGVVRPNVIRQGSSFSSDGELVVTRVPSTTFRGSESVILAVKVIGTRSIKPPTGGEVFVPYLEFVGAWPVAPERAQLLRLLADARALAAETRDGQVGGLIERALEEALPAPISITGATSRDQ